MPEGKITLTMQGLMNMMRRGKATVYRKLAEAGIERRKLDTEPPVWVYDVPPSFVLPEGEIERWYLDNGYITSQSLAYKVGILPSVARGRLRALDWRPDWVDSRGFFYYKETPELIEAVSSTRRANGHIRSDAKPRPPSDPEPRPKYVFKGKVAKLVEEEKEKRGWVGKKGRLRVEGHVIVEGIIESVSSCGVYIKGSIIRGNLDELELAEVDGGDTGAGRP